MTTIAQAITNLAQQLRELTDEDSKKCFEGVYAYGVRMSDMADPCATILAETSRHAHVTAYVYVLDREQAEKHILAIADACGKRWGTYGRFGWMTHTTGTYRTFSFVLACE